MIMMKKKFLILGMAGMLAVATLLGGCGGSDKGSSDSYAAEDYAAAGGSMGKFGDSAAKLAEYADSEEAAVETEAVNEITDEQISDSSQRKLIKTVDMSLETDELDALLADIERKIEALGGYAESTNIGGRSYNNPNSNRYANIVARIPNKRLNEFVSSVKDQANVTDKSERVEDVTLEYVDIQSHIDSLKIEQTQLKEMLEKADELETIITLQERLTQVRYEIESYQSRILVMQNQVDYSTVYLNINEVEQFTIVPTVEKSAMERIAEGFGSNLHKVGHGLKEFLIGFVIALPFILVFVGVILLIIFLISLFAKFADKQTRKNIEKIKKQEQPAKEIQNTSDGSDEKGNA